MTGGRFETIIVGRQVVTRVATVVGPPGSASPEALQAAVEAGLLQHEEDPTPHEAYDDMASLTMWYENRKA